MADMKQSKKIGDALGVEAPESEYPYGLRVDLDFEALEKLGLSTTPPVVGQTVEFKATAKVVAVRAKDGAAGNVSAELQITDMEIEKEKEQIDAKTLYPNSVMA